MTPDTPDLPFSGTEIPIQETPAPGQTLATEQTPAPGRRVVLLGASNLLRGMPLVARWLPHFWPEPLEVLVATGYGRSYGLWCRVLARELPPLRSCALWDELDRQPRLPTVALVTDLGNDLIYGVGVAELTKWVESCVTRLQDRNIPVTLTLLPATNADRTHPWHYWVFRSAMAPRSTIGMHELARQAHEVNAWLLDRAPAAGWTLVKPEPDWYAWFDPLHYSGPARTRAWGEILRPWRASSELPPVPRPTWREEWTYSVRLPAESRWFGQTVRRAQPRIQLPNGTTFEYY